MSDSRSGSLSPSPSARKVPDSGRQPVTEDTTVDELEAQIRTLEANIQRKRTTLEEQKGLLQVHTVNLQDAKEKAQEADRRLAEAQEELKAAERERTTLLPQYERAKQNEDHREKAEKYRTEIEETEQHLHAADAEITKLEKELQKVSTQYKDEREHKSLLVTKLSVLVDDLRSSIAAKIAATVPIDEAEGAVHPKLLLDSIREISFERETRISQVERQITEYEAVVAMKKQRALEIMADSDRNISLMRAAKDEEIRRIIAQFQDERDVLLRDIEEIRAVNAQQQESLRHTHIVSEAKKEQPTVSLGERGERRSGRHDATPGERILEAKTAELEQERETLTERIKRATAERQALVASTKALRQQVGQDKDRYNTVLRGIEQQIHQGKANAAELERENKRLEEACENLAVAVKNARNRKPVSAS